MYRFKHICIFPNDVPNSRVEKHNLTVSLYTRNSKNHMCLIKKQPNYQQLRQYTYIYIIHIFINSRLHSFLSKTGYSLKLAFELLCTLFFFYFFFKSYNQSIEIKRKKRTSVIFNILFFADERK
jgi:hypothetical protein